MLALPFILALLAAAPDSSSELDRLRAEVARLKAENAELRAALVAKGGSATRPAAVLNNAKPRSTFLTRVGEEWSKAPAPRSRQARAERQKYFEEASAIDARIQAYLAQHPVDRKIAESVWAGSPTIGMSLEQLKLIGEVWVKDETKHTKYIKFTPFNGTTVNRIAHDMTLDETGRVSQIEWPFGRAPD